jgi:hypothetical protein
MWIRRMTNLSLRAISHCRKRARMYSLYHCLPIPFAGWEIQLVGPHNGPPSNRGNLSHLDYHLSDSLDFHFTLSRMQFCYDSITYLFPEVHFSSHQTNTWPSISKPIIECKCCHSSIHILTTTCPCILWRMQFCYDLITSLFSEVHFSFHHLAIHFQTNHWMWVLPLFDPYLDYHL